MIKNNTPFNILISFAYADRQIMTECLKAVEAKEINLMIDSGAFTAFNKLKKEITLDGYCSFLQEWSAICEKYVMFDVIGNKEASKRNYEEMLQRGLLPMYTATIYDNDFEYIRQTLENCNDICVAGGATTNGQWIRKRYIDVWKQTGEKARIHALGFVKNPDIFRLPIISMDSSSYNCGRRYGFFNYFSQETHKIKNVSKTSLEFPKESRERLHQLGISPQMIKKYDKGGSSVMAFLGIVAYVEFQIFCWANKKELFLSVPNLLELQQVLWVYRNFNNLSYSEFLKRFTQ